MFLIQLLLLFALCRESTSSQVFLPPFSSTVTSLVSISQVSGFANEHVTVRVMLPITPFTVTDIYSTNHTGYPRDIATTASTYVVTSISTALQPAGTLFIASNDTFYTHRWWPSVGVAVPNDRAFYAAQCTPHTASAETWECSSWSMTITGVGVYGVQGVTTAVFSSSATATPSAVVTAHNLYTINGVQLMTELSTAPKNTSAQTSSTSIYSSSISTRTMTYSATRTTIAPSI